MLLESPKRALISKIDISVADREISVLNSNKIPEKLEKFELFVGVPKKFQFSKIDLFFILGS